MSDDATPKSTKAPKLNLGGLTINVLPGEDGASAERIARPAPVPAPTNGGEAARAKVVIVGSGPAGLTAAIYAARANLQPIVLAGYAPGGQLMLTSDVENYPGFPEGIQGPDLMALFRQQAERFGARIFDVDVDRVDLGSRPFGLWADGVEYRAEAVIVATGASALWLGIESETRLRGRGVSACATCDGFFFRGRDVAVVGGGDTALEDALYLTRFATKVHVVHRRDAFRGSKIMQERAGRNPKIEIHYNRVVAEILGGDQVEAIRLADTKEPREETLPVQGVFVAIGHKPNVEVFRDWLGTDEHGYLVTQGGTSASAIDGVFIAGDVDDHRYRQAVTAAGEGCKAAIAAERWLEANPLPDAAEPQEASALRGSSS